MKAPLLTLAAVLVLASCQTAPPPLATDSPTEVYFQRAQAASDQGQYDEALAIYQLFLTNQPKADAESTFSARYEIALLQEKKGHRTEAMAGYQSLIDDFGNLDKSAGAPAWVKVLAQKKLQELQDQGPKPKTP